MRGKEDTCEERITRRKESRETVDRRMHACDFYDEYNYDFSFLLYGGWKCRYDED